MEFFKSHNTSLPTTYVFNAAEIGPDTDILDICKVRPIVSCCGSPTEKLAWLCTTVLSPLLDYVPSHLKNTHDHLKTLAELPADKLKGWKFCSGDVSSLYTNIDIIGCVDNVIDFASEHAENLELYGLSLVDIHEMLEFVFGNAYFVFNNKLYLQLVGLPINVIFLPGMKLGDLFCCSRPYDKKRCTLLNCMICPKLPEGTSCAIMCPVYLITCKICKQKYVGESCRSLHDLLS